MLDDPINGTVHLCERENATVHGDLDLEIGETVTLAAGSLPDGRPVVIDVTTAD